MTVDDGFGGRKTFQIGGHVADVKNVVRKYLLDNFVMVGDITIGDDSSFMKGHILDSTGFLELISFIEETFNITIEDIEMVPENLDSLHNIESYLARKGAASPDS